MKKFHPILFSTPMVQAILEGRKTMTRRKFKPKDEPYLINEKSFINYSDSFGWNVKHKIQSDPDRFEITQTFKCPYGKVGDILWVREKWRHNETQTGFPYHYYQDDEIYTDRDNEKWKPSIFMPKSACRIFLKITNVRVERLQDISEADAINEGIEKTFISDEPRDCRWKNYINNGKGSFCEPTSSFESLWESINGTESLKANPFVWVVEFKKIEKPENFC